MGDIILEEINGLREDLRRLKALLFEKKDRAAGMADTKAGEADEDKDD
jgi:hypothetical protein